MPLPACHFCASDLLAYTHGEPVNSWDEPFHWCLRLVGGALFCWTGSWGPLQLLHSSLHSFQDAAKTALGFSSSSCFSVLESCDVSCLYFLSHQPAFSSWAWRLVFFIWHPYSTCSICTCFSSELLSPYFFLWARVASTNECTMRGCELISPELTETYACHLNAVLLLMHSRTVLVCLPTESCCRLLLLKSSIMKQKQH